MIFATHCWSWGSFICKFYIFFVVVVVIIVVIDNWSWPRTRSGPFWPRSVGSAGSVGPLVGSLLPGASRTALSGQTGLQQRLGLAIEDSTHPQQLDELREVTAGHVRPEVWGNLFLFLLFLLPESGIVIVLTTCKVTALSVQSEPCSCAVCAQCSELNNSLLLIRLTCKEMSPARL